ncbi:phage antirepressor KilAC domain-containing protein [Sodalis sp. (in: enterobacteria)]|uniref:phage antirepressor KilAC domain-containing protein n=1 Tax=Sodalis sp. (in: enterobacteria) TaxID=1898979 RepID=UPI003F332B47
MQNLTIAQTLTMSSLEIAQLVGSRHGDVKRSIERLAASMVIQLPPMAKVENKQSNSPNRFSEAYIFEGEKGKRDSIIVVAQLCPEFTARLVDRWQELEKQLAIPADPIQMLNDPAAMRGILLTYTEKVIAPESKVEEMAPNVKALHRIAKSDGGMCITNAAKELQVRPKDLFAFLRERGWIYRRVGGKNWMAYQNRIQSGYLEHKISVVPCNDGTDKIREQVIVTPKGLAKLSQTFCLEPA